MADFMLESRPMRFVVELCNSYLEHLGVPVPLMDAEQLSVAIVAIVLTLAGYYIFFGKRHRVRRRNLFLQLREAQLQVNLEVPSFTIG